MGGTPQERVSVQGELRPEAAETDVKLVHTLCRLLTACLEVLLVDVLVIMLQGHDDDSPYAII